MPAITIDAFIASLKKSEKPFVYEKPFENRHFMLSYDMTKKTVDEHYGGDFRHFIIAALHAKGARELKSYVATTIYFEADSKINKSWDTMNTNWTAFFKKAFHKDFKMMFGMLRMFDKSGPIFVKIPDESIESNFDAIRDSVIAKFTSIT